MHYREVNKKLNDLKQSENKAALEQFRNTKISELHYYLNKGNIMEFSKDIEKLKSLILEKEHIDNILVCTGNSYHVVSGSVIDFDEDYIFNFEGFSFHLEIDEIVSYVILP